jgi:hypothetical protein
VTGFGGFAARTGLRVRATRRGVERVRLLRVALIVILSVIPKLNILNRL